MAATEVKIPKGWRKLRNGAVIKRGDKFRGTLSWKNATFFGHKVGWDSFSRTPFTYIRRLSPTPKQVKAKGLKGKGK